MLRGVTLRFLARPGALVGLVLVAGLVGIAVVGPLLVGHDPLRSDVDHGLTALGAPLAPSGEALLGTDPLGRDVWARLVAAAGTSLGVAGLATLFALVIGAPLGLIAGYTGGATDRVVMRVVDLALAFPFVLVAILLAAVLRETALAGSPLPVIVTLAAVGWAPMARVVRGKAAALARRDMVLAAHALGASPARVVWRHVVPNLAGLVIALATLALAQNLMTEAMLSYLGLGPPPPAPTWGRMLFEGRAYYRTSPHLVIAPGVAIALAVVGFHLLGEALRSAFDPREAA